MNASNSVRRETPFSANTVSSFWRSLEGSLLGAESPAFAAAVLAELTAVLNTHQDETRPHLRSLQTYLIENDNEMGD